MKNSELRKLWGKLQDHQARTTPVVRRTHIDQLRGIRDLTVHFRYPVSVLAGENGCGKSTVLAAVACGYKSPEGSAFTYTPNNVLQRYEPTSGNVRDDAEDSRFRISIGLESDEVHVDWTRGARRWSRFSSKADKERIPERECYLRTMTTVVESTEARRVFGIPRGPGHLEQTHLSPQQIAFARAIVPHLTHREVVSLSRARKNMLFTIREDDAKYSELQMAGGERVALRLGLEFSEMRDALVLIDEVEAGLHPRAQELLMVGLQRLALQNNLQFIVSTHSPVVLDSVPPIGRLFLERTVKGTACLDYPYPDVVRDVLYGRPVRGFNLLCEDEVAEALLNGVLDYFVPREEWPRGGIQVLRNTGASEFPTHAKAFDKYGVLDRFAFVLDGDQKAARIEKKLRQVTDQPIIFLPGEAPEEWVWGKLHGGAATYAELLGVSQKEHDSLVEDAYATYINTNGSAADKFKHMLMMLAEGIPRTVPEICRIVARKEVESPLSEIRPVGSHIRDAFLAWRHAEANWDD